MKRKKNVLQAHDDIINNIGMGIWLSNKIQYNCKTFTINVYFKNTEEYGHSFSASQRILLIT